MLDARLDNQHLALAQRRPLTYRAGRLTAMAHEFLNSLCGLVFEAEARLIVAEMAESRALLWKDQSVVGMSSACHGSHCSAVSARHIYCFSQHDVIRCICALVAVTHLTFRVC